MSPLELPPSLQESHRLHRRGGTSVLVRRDWEAALPVEEMLAGSPLSAWGRPLPHALCGRGEVLLLGTARGDIVAKRLQRGGVVGAVLRTRYLDPRRPLREAAAAEELLRRGCATPVVVAVRIKQESARLFALELATAHVGGTADLLDALRERPGEARVLLARTGRALRRLHDAGLVHRDLQLKNLLVPLGDASAPLVVIDLDRCRLGEPLQREERVRALVRLLRSLVKHGLLRRGGADARACRALFEEYLAGGGRRAELWRECRRRLRRAVSAHRWLWPAPPAC